MKKFNCPSCAAEVVFHSSLSVYIVCKYCNSMIVRHDVDVESIGTMAALPDDMSPLQIGTEGKYNGMRFGIIGRLKIGWDDGMWNEWFLYNDDGRKGWLAEAQGSYGICFEIDDESYPSTIKAIKSSIGEYEDLIAMNNINTILGRNSSNTELSAYIVINEKQFKIVDIKQAICIGSEGELPFSAPKGRKSTSIDLISGSGEFATIDIEEEKYRVYVGEYLEWKALQFKNIRQLEGW